MISTLLSLSFSISLLIETNNFVLLKSSSSIAVFKNDCISTFSSLQCFIVKSKTAKSFSDNLYFYQYIQIMLYIVYRKPSNVSNFSVFKMLHPQIYKDNASVIIILNFLPLSFSFVFNTLSKLPTNAN